MPLAKGHFSLKFTSCRCQITAAGFLSKSALTWQETLTGTAHQAQASFSFLIGELLYKQKTHL
jgi:hypothetical protein